MNKIKLVLMFLAAALLIHALVVPAQPGKDAQPKQASSIAPQRSPHLGTLQGYQMVTDALDVFGGESESDNYRIPVNSGGQTSPIGFSESTNWGMAAGYVSATRVSRGDINADGMINVGDVVSLVNYLYRDGDEPCPVEAGDVTCDEKVNVGDIVVLVNYLFRDGDPPPC
ncbi:MAG: dockerin type I repeat-containing protein [Candidatus Zixiibacteriota bacterium]|nr:MAG: dockerin type I repeat-containing protein [candidate division Zixibacteria bacterium]